MDFTERIGKKKDNEISLYTVAIGEIDPFATGEKAKAQEDAINFIKERPGFVGVHSVVGRGTLLLFRTEELAKLARDALKDRGCPVGKNVTECYVPKKSVPMAQ